MKHDDNIFVSIACLADPDILDTVIDLFEKAARPDRVRAGVCLQIDTAEEYLYQNLLGLNNVSVDILPYQQARGPIYARARCERLLGDEAYFLQVDCHTRFMADWDEILIRELDRARLLSEQAVLSHYPVNIKNMKSTEHLRTIGQVNRFRHVGPDAIKSHGSLISLPDQPLLSIGISAAMLFMQADTRRAIPYDPDLHFGLHAAEQVLYAARLWTHGYDIYTPTSHTLATEYEGSRSRIPEYIKQACNRNRGSWPERTWTKVKYLLELDSLEQVDPEYRASVGSEDFQYGVGNQRSLLDYYRFSGLHQQLPQYFPNYTYLGS